MSHVIGKLQFSLRLHPNWKYAWKFMGLHNGRSPNLRNFEILNLGVLGQNDIWVQPPWPSIENTIRGKVVASPKSGLWWILLVCVCQWFVHASKVFQLHTNQLVVWFVWFVWIIDLLIICPSPHTRAPIHPSTPEVLGVKECTPILSFFVVFIFKLAFESFKECGGA